MFGHNNCIWIVGGSSRPAPINPSISPSPSYLSISAICAFNIFIFAVSISDSYSYTDSVICLSRRFVSDSGFKITVYYFNMVSTIGYSSRFGSDFSLFSGRVTTISSSYYETTFSEIGFSTTSETTFSSISSEIGFSGISVLS